MNDDLSPDRRRALRSILSDTWFDLNRDTPAHRSGLRTAAIDLMPEATLLLGIDEAGLPHLLVGLRSNVRRRTVLRTRGVLIDVRSLVMDDQPPRNFIDLQCRIPDLSRAFLSLSTEICVSLAIDPREPLATITRLVEEWRALFGNAPGGWTRTRTVGTFAELLVLSRVLERHPSAIETWVGPTGAAQDFRSPGRAIEVKGTLAADGRLVTIHGWDQLEPPEDGTLYLAWFRLLQSDAGDTVRDLAAAVIEMSDNPTAARKIISGLALPSAEHDEVDGLRLSVQEERWLLVSESFPRITASAFGAGAVPGGVVDLSYRIDLDTVPAECDVRDWAPVLDMLADSR